MADVPGLSTPALAASLRTRAEREERVWGYGRDTLSCHRSWADQAAREAATANLLSHLQARFDQPNPGQFATCPIAQPGSARRAPGAQVVASRRSGLRSHRRGADPPFETAPVFLI